MQTKETQNAGNQPYITTNKKVGAVSQKKNHTKRY